MELVKNIFFNTDKLTVGSTVKISYIGKFFQDESKNVFFHYGFGEDVQDFLEAEMVKTELGYQTEVELIDSNLFNFCFKNEKDEYFGKERLLEAVKLNIGKAAAEQVSFIANSIYSFCANREQNDDLTIIVLKK